MENGQWGDGDDVPELGVSRLFMKKSKSGDISTRSALFDCQISNEISSKFKDISLNSDLQYFVSFSFAFARFF